MSVSATAARIAINNAQNTKDARIKCENFIIGYEHEGSKVEESVQYAQCINTLYPTTTQADLMVFKGVSLTLLVFIIIGAVVGVSLLTLIFLVLVLFL